MSGVKQVKLFYIIGAGGFGREVAWLVVRINAIFQRRKMSFQLSQNCGQAA